MIGDAYTENNKMKRQAWLILPLALITVGGIVLFGDRNKDTLAQPNIVESSPQGMLLELPVVTTNDSTTSTVSWQTQWVPASDTARQQVLQSLVQYRADFKQLRPQLEIWAEPGSSASQKLALRMGEALAQNYLGRVNQDADPPVALSTIDRVVLLVTTKDDRLLATRMLAALTPYLSGRVSVRFDDQITAQSMHLYFFGSPYFNDQGQATFDDPKAQAGHAN